MEKEISSKLSVASVETSKVQKSRRQKNPNNSEKFSRLTVSRPFRELIEREFPLLGQNRAYWGMLQYLFFGTFKDKDSGQLVLQKETLSDIAGWQQYPENFKSYKFLKEFKQIIPSVVFTWDRHTPAERCICVNTLILPKRVKQALDDELLKKNYTQGRVYFIDGRTFSVAKQRVVRESCKAAANAQTKEAFSQEARDIIDYMNSRPPNLYTSILANYDSAVDIANGLTDTSVRETQLKILRSLKDQPQRFYVPSSKGNTDRIFEKEQGYLALTREVRYALIKGWKSYDLRSAQLSICASSWNVEEVQAFLRTGVKIWNELGRHFSLDASELALAKPFFKDALYSACYGMSENAIADRLSKELDNIDIYKSGYLFVKNPLIKALLAGREKQMEIIRGNGGATTCFGKRLIFGFGDLDEGQILSILAQAYEIKLLHPVIEVAKSTKDFSIVTWDHDGFTVNFTTDEVRWDRKLRKVVEEEARKNGIITELES